MLLVSQNSSFANMSVAESLTCLVVKKLVVFSTFQSFNKIVKGGGSRVKNFPTEFYNKNINLA